MAAAASVAGAAVVTGAGSGIGRALTLSLAKQGFTVLAVGRREAPLQETARLAAPGLVKVVPADVADPKCPELVLAALPEQTDLKFVVHNAAILSPVGSLEQIDRDQFTHAFAVNVTGPLFLTQKLLPKLQKGSRVLHISSGAAHRPLASWYGYCSSKAAFHMIYKMLEEELRPRGILVGSVRPGVVDTPMQEQIRDTSSELFPAVDTFIGFKEKGELISAEHVAKFLDWLLLECPEEEFGAEEWDIRDKQHHQRWNAPQ